MKTDYPHTVYEIPIELMSEFENNPYEAMRDLLAIPALVKDSLFPNPKVIEERVNQDREDPVDESNLYRWINSKSDSPKGYNIFTKDLGLSDPDLSYFIHVDLAMVEDASGMTMVHRDTKTGKVVTDFSLAVEAHKTDANRIPIGKLKHIAIYLRYHLGFNIGMVTYDGLQSAESIQSLIDNGIEAKIQSVDRTSAPYDTLRDLIHAGQLDFYDYNSVEYKGKNRSLVRELLNLSKNNVTGKVDHVTSGSKDVADSLAGAVFACINNTPDFFIPSQAVHQTDIYNEEKSPYDMEKGMKYTQELNDEFENAPGGRISIESMRDPEETDSDEYNERFYNDF